MVPTSCNPSISLSVATITAPEAAREAADVLFGQFLAG
jgi:hypothetical protein